MVRYSTDKEIPADELVDLFNSVGWVGEDKSILVEAMKKSTRVISAWDNNKLVGLIKCFDDGVWSAVIDCLLVSKGYQNKGIGSQLVIRLLKELADIGCISVSPNESKNVGFYVRFGFKLIEDARLLQIVTSD